MADGDARGAFEFDVEKVLTDIRGAIDDALVQLNLGEKNLKDLLSPVFDKVSNGVAEIRSRL
jgi:hypothetical protein